MVRNYKKANVHVRNGITYPPYLHYGEESISRAAEDVKHGRLNCNQACRIYNVPKSTLFRRIHHPGPVSISVQRQLLKPEVEKQVVELVNLVLRWNFPFTRLDLRYLAKAYLDSAGILHAKVSDNLPGVDWGRSFLERHRQELSGTFFHEKSSKRSPSSEVTINKFLTDAQNVLTGVDPQCILCFDETNLTDDPTVKKFAFKRTRRYYKHFASTSKTAFDVVYTANACGQLLPPFLIYKCEKLWESWKKSGPSETKYSKSTSGWLDSSCFEDWFNSVVVQYCRKLPPDIRKIIIGDYVSTHFTVPMLQKCQELNIIFLCLPPQSTSILQPMHVAFYESFRKLWPGLLKKWTDSKDYQTLPNDLFPLLFSQLYQEQVKNDQGKADLVAAFSEVGLYPFSVSRVKSRLLKMESNADFEEGRICTFNDEPKFVKVERLDFPANEDDFENESFAYDEDSTTTETTGTEKDPLGESDDELDEPNRYLIEDVIWEMEPSCHSNETEMSTLTDHSIENIQIKEEVITVELLSDEETESVCVSENVSVEAVSDEAEFRSSTINTVDKSGQTEYTSYSETSSIVKFSEQNTSVTKLMTSTPKFSSSTKAVAKSTMDSIAVNVPNLRRKYMKLRKAYQLKCEEVKRLKSCLNLYLNGVRVKKKLKKRKAIEM